ncbi:flagellar motor protein MotB [Lachnospiraceae bacterium ZAX-1]
MAKQRKEDPPGGGCPGWMATFGDLMNLLLCFFVLLFSMSTVEEEKFEMVVASIQSTFSILPAGGSAIGEGMMISSGVSQLELLDTYFKDANAEGTSETENDTDTQSDSETELKEKYQEESLEKSEEMAEEIEEKIQQMGIGDQVEVESNATFVRLTLNGALLFNSGESDIREDALPLVDKLGMILQNYADRQIDIEGHTDNVPIHSARFENNDVLSAYRAMAVKEYILGKTTLDPAKTKASGCGENVPVADNSTDEGRARNRRVEVKIDNAY